MSARAGRLILLAVAVGCSASATRRPPGPVVSQVVALDAEFGASPETARATFAALQDIARRVENRHRATGADIAQDIAAVLFGELRFERETESTATRFFQLSAVLRDRRGSCLGLGALVLAIGERIGVPLDGILLPGHFYVRTRGARAHNVELLRGGEAMPDEWYRGKYGPWPESGSAYSRPVSPTELGAIHWYNRGNDVRARGDWAAAEAAFARATRGFPDFAEAWASLGAIQQLRGDFIRAKASYHEAARAWPALPGLAGNLELLQRQIAGTAR